MYSQGIAAEAATLGEALLTGIAVGIYYDIFRIIRRIIHCRYANIVGQDIFFWVTSAIFVFFVTIKLNGGIVGIYFVAAVLGGWFIYMVTVGAIVMLVIEWLVRLTRKVYARLHNTVLSGWRKVTEKRESKQKIKNMN